MTFKTCVPIILKIIRAKIEPQAKINPQKPLTYAVFEGFLDYSHSIVAGGFEVIS